MQKSDCTLRRARTANLFFVLGSMFQYYVLKGTATCVRILSSDYKCVPISGHRLLTKNIRYEICRFDQYEAIFCKSNNQSRFKIQ